MNLARHYLLVAVLLLRGVLKVTTSSSDSPCGESCSDHGTCNSETGRCECPLLRHGPDCSIPYPDQDEQCKAYGHTEKSCHSFQRHLCLNACLGRGWCDAGFCHCQPGYYGADCSLSTDLDGRPQLLAGLGYQTRSRGVKIYVYELPPVTNVWTAINRIDRPLVQVLQQRLLSSGVRTANGDEADYYFVPLLMRTKSHTANHLVASIHYIRRYWPWWDRLQGGHRHLLVAPGDQGRRLLPDDLLHLTENCTYLTHWGLHKNHSVGGWQQSHRPAKDIVVPPLTPADSPIVYSPLHFGVRRRRKRDQDLFFAGRICGDNKQPVDGRCSDKRRDYSGGTRQKVSEHHWNRTRWTITTRTEAYVEALTTHTFCLSPTGGGYGRRSALSLFMGCIPVTITDGVHQPFEPELDWSQFSIPVGEADIPRLHEILESVPSGKVAEMQENARCAAQHMFYSTTFGEIMGEDGRYDAFETLMEILRMRRDYPDLDPSEYASVDDDFHQFLYCKLKPTGGPVPLCTQNKLAKHPTVARCRQVHANVPMRVMYMFYSWPGGAICGNNSNVAACPRSWL